MVLSGLSRAELMKVRTLVVTDILSTDMAKHFEFSTKFQQKLAG